MALLNNALYDAAYIGFLEGALAGRPITNATASSYLALTQAAQAFAKQVDAGIAFDATISTGGSNTMLVDTGSNTIQANTQFKPDLLRGICSGAMNGRFTEDATQADYATVAAACIACYTEALLLLVTP